MSIAIVAHVWRTKNELTFSNKDLIIGDSDVTFDGNRAFLPHPINYMSSRVGRSSWETFFNFRPDVAQNPGQLTSSRHKIKLQTRRFGLEPVKDIWWVWLR